MRRIHLRSGRGREDQKYKEIHTIKNKKLQGALTAGKKPPMVQNCNGIEAE